jgi:hypothetical protein
MGGQPTSAENQSPGSVTESSQEEYGNQAINLELLRSKWLEFANKQSHFLAQTLRSVIPHIKNEMEVCISLANGFQKEKVDGVYQDLIPYLRKALNNNQFKLNIELSENVKVMKAFTPKEKIEELMKENPALATLIEKFGLEIE